MLFFDEVTASSTQSSGDESPHALAMHFYDKQAYDFDINARQPSLTSADIKRLRHIEDDFSFQLKKAQLTQFVPASIPYLSHEEKTYWQVLLSDIFEGQLYLYHYHQITNRKQHLKDDLKTLKQLKAHLMLLASTDATTVSLSHSTISAESARLVTDIRDVQYELCHCPSVAMRKWLTELNWYRLYWIWVGGGGGLLSGLLDALKQDKASKRLETPASGLAVISYSLYFTRLAFHLLMMFKHLVPGPWMSESEKLLIPPMERLTNEWHKCKFVMINDIVWGAINLATANWLLTGVTHHAKLLGAWGGLLNVVLMSVDIAVSIWQLREEESQYKQQKEALTLTLENLKQRLQIEKDAQELAKLERQQRMAKEQLEILTENWQYRRQTLVMARNIAVAFVPAMILLCASLFPPLIPIFALSQVALNAMVISGGVAATGLTLFQTWHSYQTKINQLNTKLDKLAKKESEILTERNELLAQSSRTEDEAKRLKQLTLVLQKVQLDANYHQKMINYHRASQVFSMISQVVFPAIVMGALFAPPPVAVAIIVVAVVLLAVAKITINHYKPTETDNSAIKLDQAAENEEINPSLSKRLEPKKPKWSFFKKQSKSPPKAILPVAPLSVATS